MLLRVKVKPGSRHPRIEREEDGSLTVHVKAPPVEGKANDELVRQLAERFEVPRSRVRVKSGLASRHKFVEIEGYEPLPEGKKALPS